MIVIKTRQPDPELEQKIRMLLEREHIEAEQKRTLATVNALLGNVFLTSDMPSRYTGAQRAEYRRLRDIFEHAEQVKVKTEDGAVCIHYLLYGRPQKLLCSPF